MSQKLSPSIEASLGFIEGEWEVEETRHFRCNACGHFYADADGGGAIRGANSSFPARCFESRNGRRCAGKILEVAR